MVNNIHKEVDKQKQAFIPCNSLKNKKGHACDDMASLQVAFTKVNRVAT